MNLMPASSPVRLDLADRSYDIHIDRGLLAHAGELIRPVLRQHKLFVVADPHVAKLHLGELRVSLAHAGITADYYVTPEGEAAKSFGELEKLLEAILDTAPERSTTLLAFGGGVVGDLTGFAASVLLRGVPFIQMPTTLLSQVDSSVGGKTGINSRHGKNLIGAFHQPKLVLADIDLLSTLSPRQLASGYGEVMKYGLIDDPHFFAWLERHGKALLDGDFEARKQAVHHSVCAKARIVAADEREAGQRALLNLGHTFGHALEAETGFSDKLLHGESVALGCLMAFDLSVRLGLCPSDELYRLRRHLEQTGLPVKLPHGLNPAALYTHFAHDKKVKDGKLTFILARGIGKSFISREVPEATLHELLADWVRP
jgi:3-dehydroquinate synthase